MSDQMDTNRTSLSRRQETVTITEAVCSCSASSEVIVVERMAPGSSSVSELAGAVVPLLIGNNNDIGYCIDRSAGIDQ